MYADSVRGPYHHHLGSLEGLNRDKRDILSFDKYGCIHMSSMLAVFFEIMLLDYVDAMQVQCLSPM